MLIESVSINSITDSIKNLYQVVINYEGDPAHGIAPGKRVIEVQAYGLTKSGNPVIRAYQPYGDTASTVPEWKFFRLRKKPLFSVSPLRNKFQNNELPICAKTELMYKSCFSNASAKLQLGVSSSVSEYFKSSPNSSVTKGRFAIVSYFSDLG